MALEVGSGAADALAEQLLDQLFFQRPRTPQSSCLRAHRATSSCLALPPDRSPPPPPSVQCSGADDTANDDASRGAAAARPLGALDPLALMGGACALARTARSHGPRAAAG